MKKKPRILLRLVIFIVILASMVFLMSLIKINKIICITSEGPCPNEITNDIQKINPNGYFKKKANTKKYLDNSKYVQSYFIQYQIPDIFKITIELNRARYAIYNSTTSRFLLFDGDQRKIDEVNKTNLPYIVKNNDQVTDKDKFALKLIEKINRLYSIKSGNLNINENYLEIRLNENVKALFPLEGDVDYLIGSLRIIFSRLNDETQGIKMNNIKEIDLRYKNPVLR